MSRMIEHSNGEDAKSKISLNQFLSRFGYIDEDDHVTKITRLQEFMDTPIADVWKDLQNKFKSCEKDFENNAVDKEKQKTHQNYL